MVKKPSQVWESFLSNYFTFNKKLSDLPPSPFHKLQQVKILFWLVKTDLLATGLVSHKVSPEPQVSSHCLCYCKLNKCYSVASG